MTPDISFSGLLLVASAAFAAPLILGLLPRLALPAVVLEILAGIALGPAGLGWVQPDATLEVLALIGLAFLLFLAGLEIDLERLRGRALRTSAAGFGLSLSAALTVGGALWWVGLVRSPLLVAIILLATSLGVIVPALTDAGRSGSAFGQLVIAAASIADFGSIILLTLFFSREASGSAEKVVLLGGFVLMVAAAVLALRRVERSSRLSELLVRLQDTTAQIRVRGAFLLLIAFAVLAERLGIETILGAFAAGAAISLIDRDEGMTHPDFRPKLAAVGFGVFIPVFFVVSGLEFDVTALFGSASTAVLVPLFLAALLVVRGLPAVVYRHTLSIPELVAAGLLQATSLPFIVAGAQIGMELGLITRPIGSALIAAGLLSVVLFPLAALGILRRSQPLTRAEGSPAS